MYVLYVGAPVFDTIFFFDNIFKNIPITNYIMIVKRNTKSYSILNSSSFFQFCRWGTCPCAPYHEPSLFGKYDSTYLSIGFTCNGSEEELKMQCTCFEIFSNETIKSSKLKRHKLNLSKNYN
jgi:hypothetical protein